MERKKLIFYIISVMVILGLLYLAFSQERKLAVSEETRFFMDTAVTVRVFAADAEEIIDATFTAMKEVAQKADRFDPESEVSKINDPGGEPVQVSPEIFQIIESSLKWAQESQGVFDITIGSLVDVWGFSVQDPVVPSQKEIAAALDVVDYEEVEVCPAGKTVKVPQGFTLDLGGVAKGFVVDRGMEVLKDLGIEAAYINAGGDIRVLGPKPDGSPWRIGIRDPRVSENSSILEEYIVQMATGSIVTSGDYERYFSYDSQRYHHLLDPRTGYPASVLRSVSVVGPSAVEADIFSTLIFVLGNEAGREFIEKVPDYEALMVTVEGEIVVSSGFNNYLE